MLSISREAMQLCRETLRQMPIEPNTRLLRIDTAGGDVAIALDTPQNDDEIVHHKGHAVLAVPQRIAARLKGLTLQVSDEGQLVLS